MATITTTSRCPSCSPGGAGGRLKGNRHLQVARGTPLSNLQAGLLNLMDVPAERFGDSTGIVEV